MIDHSNFGGIGEVVGHALRRLGAAYLGFVRRSSKCLPASFWQFPPARLYGTHVHAVARRLAERTQSHGTFFFRNRSELELLRQLVSHKNHGSSLEVAVFACSKGAEVYSIAWTIRSTRPDLKVTIHAIDISREIVEFAKNGVYSLSRPAVSADAQGRRASDADQLAWKTYRDQGVRHDLSIFQQTTESEMQAMFDTEGDRVKVKPWLRDGIVWRTGDASDPELVRDLGLQDLVVANRFLCHMKPAAAAACLRNVARLVRPGGFLFVSGVDLEVRTTVAREMGWKPVTDLLKAIHEGDATLRNGWPLEWWGLEPFSTTRPNYATRYACVFQLGEPTRSAVLVNG
jgi:chemotaxis methyl-accepting protein methylase